MLTMRGLDWLLMIQVILLHTRYSLAISGAVELSNAWAPVVTLGVEPELNQSENILRTPSIPTLPFLRYGTADKNGHPCPSHLR